MTPENAAPRTAKEGNTFLIFEHRPSDSPLIEKVWRCHSERSGRFTSVAASHVEMVVTRLNGKSFLTIRGPETKASPADCPAGGEWLGIRFKLGTFMPQLAPALLRDRNDATLPHATNRTFWLNGSTWQYPDFENAETFVARLLKAGIVARDASVDSTLTGQPGSLSLRSAQRRFLRSTGVTHQASRQIERARYATNLLTEGVSIADAVHRAGYFDQAHLTRSLKRFMGQTPARILHRESQLSFLYKTEPPR